MFVNEPCSKLDDLTISYNALISETLNEGTAACIEDFHGLQMLKLEKYPNNFIFSTCDLNGRAYRHGHSYALINWMMYINKTSKNLIELAGNKKSDDLFELISAHMDEIKNLWDLDSKKLGNTWGNILLIRLITGLRRAMSLDFKVATRVKKQYASELSNLDIMYDNLIIWLKNFIEKYSRNRSYGRARWHLREHYGCLCILDIVNDIISELEDNK